MKGKPIAEKDSLAAHEKAAVEVAEFRKKGIHCHIEESPESAAIVRVVQDEPFAGSREKTGGSHPG